MNEFAPQQNNLEEEKIGELKSIVVKKYEEGGVSFHNKVLDFYSGLLKKIW